jgi:hypothetical protein
MGIVSIILLSIFLSSSAEARHGDYSLDHHYSVRGCRNCDKLGVTLRSTLSSTPSNAYFPPRRRQAPIWPTLPAKRIPYVR